MRELHRLLEAVVPQLPLVPALQRSQAAATIVAVVETLLRNAPPTYARAVSLAQGMTGSVYRVCLRNTVYSPEQCAYVVKTVLKHPLVEWLPFANTVQVSMVREMEAQNRAAAAGISVPVVCHLRVQESGHESLVMDSIQATELAMFLTSADHTEATKRTVCLHVAAAIHTLHTVAHVTHCDLHTRNCFVLHDLSVRIIDFGRATCDSSNTTTPIHTFRTVDIAQCFASILVACPRASAWQTAFIQTAIGGKASPVTEAPIPGLFAAAWELGKRLGSSSADLVTAYLRRLAATSTHIYNHLHVAFLQRAKALATPTLSTSRLTLSTPFLALTSDVASSHFSSL